MVTKHNIGIFRKEKYLYAEFLYKKVFELGHTNDLLIFHWDREEGCDKTGAYFL